MRNFIAFLILLIFVSCKNEKAIDNYQKFNITRNDSVVNSSELLKSEKYVIIGKYDDYQEVILSGETLNRVYGNLSFAVYEKSKRFNKMLGFLTDEKIILDSLIKKEVLSFSLIKEVEGSYGNDSLIVKYSEFYINYDVEVENKIIDFKYVDKNDEIIAYQRSIFIPINKKLALAKENIFFFFF